MATLTPIDLDLRFAVRSDGQDRFVIRDGEGAEVGSTRSPRSYCADVTTQNGSYRMRLTPKSEWREDIRGKLTSAQWEVTRSGATEPCYQIVKHGLRAEIVQPGGQTMWVRLLRHRTTGLGLYLHREDRNSCVGTASRQGWPFLRQLCSASAVTLHREVASHPDPVLLVAVLFLLSCPAALGVEV